MQSVNYAKEKEEKLGIMKDRAREVKQVLSDPKYGSAWDPYPFNSGYFMCLRLKTVEAEPLRVHLLDRYGVGLISTGKNDLRIAFSCLEKDDVQQLFDLNPTHKLAIQQMLYSNQHLLSLRNPQPRVLVHHQERSGSHHADTDPRRWL